MSASTSRTNINTAGYWRTSNVVITLQTFITAASLITAFGLLIGTFTKVVRWMDKQKKQDEEITSLKKEQQVLCYGMLAALDGLKQLGANGNVSEAHEKLEKHLNERSHN